MQNARLLPVVSFVHEHSNPGACTNSLCYSREDCITNYSISQICLLRPVSVCEGRCCHSEQCLKLDSVDCVDNFSTICDVFRALYAKLDDIKGKALIIVVADMFLDTHGRLDVNKTRCDVLLVYTNGWVDHVVEKFDKESLTLLMFSKFMKNQIVKQTIQHLQGTFKNKSYINKNDEKTQIERHIELRQSMFVQKLTGSKIETQYVVDELRASIFNFWNGKSCKQRPKYLDLAMETTIPLFEPENDCVQGFESGPYMRLYKDEHSEKGVIIVFLQHKVNFTLEHDQQHGFFVSPEHSIRLKRLCPAINHHCTLHDIPLAKYSVAFPTGTKAQKFYIDSTLTMNMGTNILCKRKRNDEIIDRMQPFFNLDLPWFFRIYTNECRIFDSAQDMGNIQKAWEKVIHTSKSDKYLLSMFFPEEVADSLKVSIDNQLARQKKDDENAEKSKLSIENCKREDESELYKGLTHSLFVGINPTLNTIKCICTDLVLGMILISNGTFCHRENVCQLMYMAKYMDMVFQLDSSDDMPPYLYLDHKIPGHIRTCYADVRRMHKNTRRILISEYISDVMNEVFYGGSIMTHDDKCEMKIPPIVNKQNQYLFNREICYRLGCDSVSMSSHELQLAMNVLIYQTGIYKQNFDQDLRIYSLRNITTKMSPADASKLFKTQYIIRRFAPISKKNKTFKRTGYVDRSMIYKKHAFQFLEDFKNQMDSDILHMIKTKRDEIAISDKKIEDEINQILTVNIE